VSTVAASMALRSLPSSAGLTQCGESDHDNEHHLFQTGSTTTGKNGVDSLLAILDAALEIVEESYVDSRHNDSADDL
jgi:hypothetical protein